MGKKKILWVVYDFVQAGGQRYVYEICKALNKEKYQIDILKVAPMNHDKNWNFEFYYEPTLALGCKIFFLSDILQHKIALKKSFIQWIRKFISKKLRLTLYSGSSKKSVSDVE